MGNPEVSHTDETSASELDQFKSVRWVCLQVPKATGP